VSGAHVTRRAFIAGIGAATAGLALGLHRAEAAAAAVVFAPNPFLQIGSDGTIAIVCHRSEMGQGVRSTLPVLIADELGADPAAIQIIQGDADPRYGSQDTDGSSSIRVPYLELRKLAATARVMLIEAAAARWGVPAGRLVAKDGKIYDGKRALSFGELAAAAAKRPVPKDPKLRPPASCAMSASSCPMSTRRLRCRAARSTRPTFACPGCSPRSWLGRRCCSERSRSSMTSARSPCPACARWSSCPHRPRRSRCRRSAGSR
jgi:isoquinoline 1-oxidoreductase beta subunit